MRRSGQPRGWLVGQRLRKVHVHTVEDTTIEGVLAEDAADGVVLRAAAFHEGANHPVQMQGEVFIPRQQIAFIQVTGGGE